MNQTIRIALASALITGAALKAVPALGEPVTPLEVSVVRTADLDLSSKAGRQELDARLAHAAREVCGVASDADLKGKNDVRKCREDVLSDAKAQREQLYAAARRGATTAMSAARK